jgi:hypothetical protein
VSRFISFAAFSVCVACVFSAACDDNDAPTVPEGPQPLNFEFSFQSSDEGFVAGFADYPAGDEENYELEGGWSELPEHDSLTTDDKGIMLHGRNASDDLFMFVKCKLGASQGVAPDVIYQLDMTVKLASENGTGCVGAGGAPGEANYFKAGASAEEPKAEDTDGFMELSVDKGQQATGGPAAWTIGNLANGVDSCEADVWRYKTLQLEEFYVKASGDGEIWLLLGTDSGYEGITTYYITDITADLTPTELDSIPDDALSAK